MLNLPITQEYTVLESMVIQSALQSYIRSCKDKRMSALAQDAIVLHDKITQGIRETYKANGVPI